MNKKVSLGVAIAVALLAVALAVTLTLIVSMRLFDQKVSSFKSRGALYDKLDEIDTIVRGNYYGEIDDDTLYKNVAQGYMNGIDDSDSIYLSAEDLAARNALDEGSVTSIGVDGVKDEATGYLKVTKVYDGTAASTAGIVEGDFIIRLGDTELSPLTYEEMEAALQGNEGDTVTVTYSHDTSEATVDMDFTTYELESVSYYNVDGLSYIGFTRDFNDTTVSQFLAALKNVDEAQDRGLVIDLRNVDGGIKIDYAERILDELLPAGEIIGGNYKNGEYRTIYTSDEDYVNLPIVVLVNENTTGFAELIAAVLQDADNVDVVGMTTSGNGRYQTVYQLTDGSAVLLSVCEFTTGSGKTFDETGVVPDFIVEPGDTQIVTGTSPDADTDPQFRKAEDVIRSLGLSTGTGNQSGTSSSSSATSSDSTASDSTSSSDSTASSSDSSGSSSETPAA
ncbi:MAG: S41 family peptidase [Oscillospiraceae bacterium]|jgi:carboxyl-terminal processing protease